ncbi:TRAP transporter large permease [Sporosarcina sp. P3]|uniref:TRAP transporter large permease n=1 Tax=Sporosarcina TaxID=1569 RepID=UPI0009DC774D|nr:MULTISPECIES: TRAP transporter large permease [Sporosarcina]ARF17801.1 C4-dicarboxylate ABC transporter [Sporosarcina ureae]PID20180.1 TRAP transporter large permease [Sporosarcina sp. P3]
MSPFLVGLLIATSVIVLMLLGMPIFLSLGIVATVTMLLLGPLQFDMLGEQFFSALNGFELLAIPLFILMSAFFAKSDAGKDLFELAYRWFGKIPGGLAIANIFACGVFSALSGSSPATAAAIGGMGIPEMRKRGYPGEFAAAIIIAGGTLGILIPPSITMIIYGVAVQVSIGKLFLAGVLPGVLLIFLFSVWAAIYWIICCKKSGARLSDLDDLQIDFSWKEKFESLFKAWPSVLLIILIIGSLYSGVVTPSEIAALGAVVTLLIVLLWYRSLNRKSIQEILTSGARESSMILLIVAGALLLTYPISYLRVPQAITESLITLDISKWWIFIIINIVLLILGMFLPPAAIIVMVAPILAPLIHGLGFDPIWFAVIMTLNMEIGLITPPVGLNLFVVKPLVPDITFTEIFKAVIPFIIIIVITIILICIFPQIALWLPSLI